MMAACGCRFLYCGKCAAVAASLPDPSPCPLCGAEGVAPFEASECKVDVGVLVVVHRAAPAADR